MRRRDGHQARDPGRPPGLSREQPRIEAAGGEPHQVHLLGTGLLEDDGQTLGPRRGPDGDGVVRVDVRRVGLHAASSKVHRLGVEHAALHQVGERSKSVQEDDRITRRANRRLRQWLELDGESGNGLGAAGQAGEHGRWERGGGVYGLACVLEVG